MDAELAAVAGAAAGLLVVSTGTGLVLERTASAGPTRAALADMNRRLAGWWIMGLGFLASLLGGAWATLALWSLVSSLALRELLTVARSRPADHGVLCWSAYAVVPVQYWLIAGGRMDWAQGLVPVWAFALLAIRGALAGSPAGFFQGAAELFWGLMVCVYALSHVPALLTLPGRPGDEAAGLKLLVFLVAAVQAGDVFSYVWGKALGRRALAPALSPGKTWEGLLGGLATATAVGAALQPLTSWTLGQASVMALAAAALGAGGGLVMSAVKRDRGVKDWGALIPGHGGMLDRVDSLAFAAPAFFHLARALGA
jgi:phosphatidate cytidylyltransferase